MNDFTVQLSLSGRPLAERSVRLKGVGTDLRTDERGHLRVNLASGKYMGDVETDGESLTFTLVSAPGLSRMRIDLREPERTLGDAAVLEVMPATRYTPLKLLGQGGAGRVYKCRDTSLDRLVAIKILNEEFAGTPESREDFLTEARVLAQVENPQLLQIYDFGIQNGRAYMVVQYVDGPNLEDLVRAEGPLSLGSVAAAGVQLAHALAAIHEAGLLHCDVKPGNGLVDRKGVVRLADFGLVKPIIDYADPRSRVFGTPSYMSPEQLQGQPMGPAGDVYSLGTTLYHLAAGNPPFTGKDLIVSHIFAPPPDIRDVRPEADSELTHTLQQMMAKEPPERPTVREVIGALLPFATDVPHRDDLAYLPRLTSPTLSLLGPGSVPRPGSGQPAAVTGSPESPRSNRPSIHSDGSVRADAFGDTLAGPATPPGARSPVRQGWSDAPEPLGHGPARPARTWLWIALVVIAVGASAVWFWANRSSDANHTSGHAGPAPTESPVAPLFDAAPSDEVGLARVSSPTAAEPGPVTTAPGEAAGIAEVDLPEVSLDQAQLRAIRAAVGVQNASLQVANGLIALASDEAPSPAPGQPGIDNEPPPEPAEERSDHRRRDATSLQPRAPSDEALEREASAPSPVEPAGPAPSAPDGELASPLTVPAPSRFTSPFSVIVTEPAELPGPVEPRPPAGSVGNVVPLEGSVTEEPSASSEQDEDQAATGDDEAVQGDDDETAEEPPPAPPISF